MVLSSEHTLPIVRMRPSQGEQIEVASSFALISLASGLSLLVKKSVKVEYYSNLSR